MSQQFWWKQISSDAISEAFEESTVDAYGDHEQCMSLLCAIEEQLDFPFVAVLAGVNVSIVGIEQSKHDSLGLDLICEKDGKRYAVAAGSFEMTDELSGEIATLNERTMV